MNVFLTGGTRGIGLGLVKDFQALGHKVAYTGTSMESIEKSGHKNLKDAFAYVCDVRNRKDLRQVLHQAKDAMGSIDLFINNAGVNQANSLVMNLSEEEIAHVIDVNVTGMVNATSEALQVMVEQGYGYLYNMEGLGSNNMVFPKTVIYASSKHFLTFFTKGVRKEMKAYKDIQVGTISPGMVFTDLLKTSGREDGMKIANILGSQVSEVSPFLVKNMIKGKRKIEFLTKRRILWKFVKSLFMK
jgi:NADP-dependent 3-hydroxy acid dehydrogenase YdfG